ncbi:excinuclease ABC subunit C [uncultured Pontibacter sp.]|uniref:excinuclease ABC subunit C n=1 Tax=uncultured Pontibacter sp. TaxID=453356 RepID=UPI0026302592|nr:excinuclease ABC subunit C [uncultured Pontibacter sp.]
MQPNQQAQHYFVYIMGDQSQPHLNIGVSKDLQHDMSLSEQPNLHPKLVYYEHYDMEEIARVRERHIKACSPEENLRLVESMNPNWLDLADTLS